MTLPCRHIFKFRDQNNIDLFAPELCDPRWTKQYYRKSHPALTMNEEIPSPAPIYVQRVQTPGQKDKYEASASITKEINSVVTSISTSELNSALDKLKKIRYDLTTCGTNKNLENEDSPQGERIADNTRENEDCPMDLSVPNSSTYSKLSESTNVEFNGRQQVDTARLLDRAPNDDEPSHEPMTQHQFNESQLVIMASTSSQHIRSVNLPSKRRSAGRPKGSVNNVIGLKRTNASKVRNSKKAKVTEMIQPESEMKSARSNRVLRKRKT